MKFSILVLFLLVISLGARAQIKETDFYTLLQTLIPNKNAVGKWPVGNNTEVQIKWQNTSPKKYNSDFKKIGEIKISFNGKTFACKNNKSCNWELALSGKNINTYSGFEINGYPKEELDVALEKLLGKKNYELKLLKTDIEGAITHFLFYELKLPDKNTVWIMTGISSDSDALLMNISCFFNKKDMEERISN